MRIIVLGSAAGGGFPQWNCRCPNCQLAWNGDPRVVSRTQSSVAVSVDGASWVLLNVSPDIIQQIRAAKPLQPRREKRDTPIEAAIVTNGDIDHIAGLLSLREQQAFDLYASAPTLAAIAANPVFQVLDPVLVRRKVLELDQLMEFSGGLRIVPFAVPGKVPLYAEGSEVEIGIETGATLGLEISAGASRVYYIPGCASVSPKLLERLGGADVLMFDGTTYTNDEMVRLGLSPKTAWRMGHIAMSGPQGSMAAFGASKLKRKIYLHINNTNPVLVDGSPERAAAEDAGWEIAFDAMEILV